MGWEKPSCSTMCNGDLLRSGNPCKPSGGLTLRSGLAPAGIQNQESDGSTSSSIQTP